MNLLATVQITLSRPGGAQLRVRALVDQGSEASFIKESIVHSLQLRKHRASIPLIWAVSLPTFIIDLLGHGVGLDRLGIDTTSRAAAGGFPATDDPHDWAL